MRVDTEFVAAALATLSQQRLDDCGEVRWDSKTKPATRGSLADEHPKPIGSNVAPLFTGYVADRSNHHTKVIQVELKWHTPRRPTHGRHPDPPPRTQFETATAPATRIRDSITMHQRIDP